MVDVHLYGCLGQRLCQYAFGRAIASTWGYQLRTSCGAGLPVTLHEGDGKRLIGSSLEWCGAWPKLRRTGIVIESKELLTPPGQPVILNGPFDSERLINQFTDVYHTFISPAKERPLSGTVITCFRKAHDLSKGVYQEQPKGNLHFVFRKEDAVTKMSRLSSIVANRFTFSSVRMFLSDLEYFRYVQRFKKQCLSQNLIDRWILLSNVSMS